MPASAPVGKPRNALERDAPAPHSPDECVRRRTSGQARTRLYTLGLAEGRLEGRLANRLAGAPPKPAQASGCQSAQARTGRTPGPMTKPCVQVQGKKRLAWL